ncbi:MAG: hypothetical protein ACRDGD_06445 [Candidatus Limnocylindria bacterium]
MTIASTVGDTHWGRSCVRRPTGQSLWGIGLLVALFLVFAWMSGWSDLIGF